MILYFSEKNALLEKKSIMRKTTAQGSPGCSDQQDREPGVVKVELRLLSIDYLLHRVTATACTLAYRMLTHQDIPLYPIILAIFL